MRPSRVLVYVLRTFWVTALKNTETMVMSAPRKARSLYVHRQHYHFKQAK